MTYRYHRQIILPELGLEGQQKLFDARILVVGCGGLGSPILLYLTAAGLGNLGIIDADVIDETNLQRQILYDTASVGKTKVAEAKKKVEALNPHVKISVYQDKLHANNALDIIGNFDLIIDGSDNFPTRYLLNDACVLMNKPFVSGAISRFEGQVGVFNYQGSSTYRDVFPAPPPPEQAPNCAESGVLGVLCGIIGSVQANEAIKIITGIGEVLAGKLWLFDSLTMQSRIVKIPKNPEALPVTALIDYEVFCGVIPTKLKEITWKKLQTWQNYQLIDVREKWEYELKNLGGILIPLSEIENNIEQIKRDIPVIIHCQSGKRSQKAIEILLEKYQYENLWNLTHYQI